MGAGDLQREWLKCQASSAYFVYNYVQIYDATLGRWIPFRLWKAQAAVLSQLNTERLNIILKARQLGMTWLVLAHGLWKMLFHPAITFLVFSRREDEATYLLDFRLRGMYDRLPEWMHVRKILKSNTQEWKLSNGSVAYGFPTTAGDSYTASLALVDEADLVPDLSKLMNAVKPTIDGGGSMVLLSRSNKEEPASPFKNMYRAAVQHKSSWNPIFLPWWVRPERTKEWYEEQKMDILGREGSLDDLYQQYPSTDEEALMAKTLDKRFPPQWVEKCFTVWEPLELNPFGLEAFVVYEEPDWRNTYSIGADPAEGNPTSDPSSLHVICNETGAEVAMLTGQIEPTTFATYIESVSRYFNNAKVLVERNNHGHAVIGYLRENTTVQLIDGWDGSPGWHTTTRGKALMWSFLADQLRDGTVTIRSSSTRTQLNSIDGKKLRAPEGLHDDEAVSYALTVRAALGYDDVQFVVPYAQLNTVGGA